MRVFFGGAEKGSYRNMLVNAGVQRFAINLTHFPLPKRKVLDLPAMFASGEIIVYTSENDEDTARYDMFLRDNADNLHMVIGRPEYDGTWLGDKYVPIWNDDQDLERLAFLCQKYGRAAVSDKAIDARNQNRINGIAQRWGAKLVGITSKTDLIERIQWDTVIVGSWTSTIRYGETQVWDGHGLRRYPAQQKESARKRHRADIIRLGLSPENVENDEVDAIGLLAIRSWQQWENNTFLNDVYKGYDPTTDNDEYEFQLDGNGQIATIPPEQPNSTLAVSGGSTIATNPLQKRHESERQLLPVMGIEHITTVGSQIQDDQQDSIEIDPEVVPVIRHTGVLLRQCDSCYLSTRCPAFKEHSECAFKMPVEIRTKDQLQAALRAMLEMQVSRVMFARFAEELEGQGLDPVLSSEMDRLFSLIEKFKNINDNRDTLRLEVEARTSSGVLSRIFGSRAGEQARALEGGGYNAQQTNALYTEILDLSEDS